MWHKDSIREEKALSHLIPWCFLAIRNSIFSYSSMTLHCSSWKFTVHKASMQWNFVPNMKWGWQNVCHVQMRDSDVKQSFRETTLFCVKIPLECLSSTFNQSSEAPVCPGHRAEMCWWTQALHFNSDTREPGGNPLAAAAQLCWREHGWGQGGSVGVSQVHYIAEVRKHSAVWSWEIKVGERNHNLFWSSPNLAVPKQPAGMTLNKTRI